MRKHHLAENCNRKSKPVSRQFFLQIGLGAGWCHLCTQGSKWRSKLRPSIFREPATYRDCQRLSYIYCNTVAKRYTRCSTTFRTLNTRQETRYLSEELDLHTTRLIKRKRKTEFPFALVCAILRSREVFFSSIHACREVLVQFGWRSAKK